MDVLINKPPSIRWYFATVIPSSALLLAVAFVPTQVNKCRRANDQDAQQALPDKERS